MAQLYPPEVRDRLATMKSVVTALVALTVLAGLSSSSPARADEPLNGSGAEPCTLESAQKENRECVVCRAYYRNRKHCERVLPDYNFSKVCRTRDVSTWREVWCRKPDAASKKISPDVMASLDDATAGEKSAGATNADLAIDDAGVSANDAPIHDSGTSPGSTSDPMVVHKPEGGCTCTSAPETNGRSVSFFGASMIAIACATVRRTTRCTKGRSDR